MRMNEEEKTTETGSVQVAWEELLPVINLGPFDQEEQKKYQKVVTRYEKLQNCFKNTRRECSV